MRMSWLGAGSFFLVLAAGACGNSTGTGSSGGGGNGGGTGSCGLGEAANAEFCQADPASPNCALVTGVYTTSVCGVPLKAPPGELQRSQNVKEYAGSGPPQLDCFLPSGYPDPPDPNKQAVTIKGIAKIFSHGCESKDLSIEIHEVIRTGGADDGDLGPVVGTPITTVADCKAAGAGQASTEEDCGTRYECFYEYANVPTETELVIKTDGALWAPLYEYNVYIPNSEVVAGAWDHDVRALAQDDYTVIPQAAFGGTVTQTHGVIAGEVHDCGNVRLINATVDTDTDKVITTYFTDNEEHPLPDPSRAGTSTLGLYAAMDIAAGPVTVAAAGQVNGGLVSVGFYRARIFPDSVTSVTFRGLKPFQVPVGGTGAGGGTGQ